MNPNYQQWRRMFIKFVRLLMYLQASAQKAAGPEVSGPVLFPDVLPANAHGEYSLHPPQPELDILGSGETTGDRGAAINALFRFPGVLRSDAPQPAIGNTSPPPMQAPTSAQLVAPAQTGGFGVEDRMVLTNISTMSRFALGGTPVSVGTAFYTAGSFRGGLALLGSRSNIFVAGALGYVETGLHIYTLATEGTGAAAAQSPLIYSIVSAIWDLF